MRRIVLLVIMFYILTIGYNQSLEKQIKNTDLNKISESKKVEFHSLDSLMISANIYEISNDAPVILLCHQARFNKFEYEGVAQRLNDLGFNCVAIDQRSGGPIGNIVNETTLRALEKNLPISYLDAEQDIQAAIDFVSDRYDKSIILWGSSYSSTLALYMAAENENVSAVVSFSPGNYFSEQKGSLDDKLVGFEKPMFITSSKQEIKYIDEVLGKMTLVENQVHFKPIGPGHHGSRALWYTQPGGEEYWVAIEEFLKMIKN